MEVQEPAIAYGKRKYTIEEYLEMENASKVKHEYYQGEIFAMAGAKMQHNEICENIFFQLRLKLKGKPCKPHMSDTRIYIEKNTLFTYPDLSVICGKPESLNNDDLNFLNPTLIFEVLSSSTKDYDLNEKFNLFKEIPTLKEYVVVDSEAIASETYYLDNYGNWQKTQYNTIGESIFLKSLQISLELKDVYDEIEIN